MKKESDIYKKIRVLVVDDHMLMRNMISQNLRSIGVSGVESASGGEDALLEIKKAKDIGRPYHIVFLDWHMPGIEGVEVLKTCRKDKAFDKTAFIMLTAEQEQRNILEAIEAGATSYIVKPVSREVLEQNLQKVLKWLAKKDPDFAKDGKPAAEPLKTEAANAIPAKLRDDLKPVVAKGIENIFSEIFKVKIVSDSEVLSGRDKDMVCIGRMHQKDFLIVLRFYFDQELLRPLLMQLYSPKFLEDKSVYEDAACEIVNILCAQIKAFMNKHGFALKLDLPVMGMQPPALKDADSIMNIHFQLNEGEDFLVDVSTDARKGVS